MDMDSRHTTCLKISVILLSTLLLVSAAHAIQTYSKRGYVLARGQILGQNDQPILVEVDDHGEELQEIGEVYDDLEGVFTMSAQTYESLVESYTLFKEANQSGIARGAVPLSVIKDGGESEYESYCRALPKVKVPAATPQASPTEKAIPCPPIISTSIRSILLRDPSTILDPELLGENGPILFQSPLDLREKPSSIGDTYKTVLLTPSGAIAKQAPGKGVYLNNVTFKWHYFQPDENEEQPLNLRFNEEVDERVLSPIAGAKVGQALVFNLFTQSGKHGEYRLSYYLPGCPCTTYDYQGLMVAEIPYKNFNPKSKGPGSFGTYAVSTQTYDFCNGMAVCPLYPSFVTNNVAGILATQATFTTPRSDLKVDAVILTGEGKIDVPIDATAYSTERATFDTEDPAMLHYDFDGDRKQDKAILYNDQYYVYLNDHEVEYDEQNPEKPINEDLKRQPDSLPDFEDRGLLESISLEDLEQTDIYVYRVSTGQLILERIGLKSEEYIPYNGGGADTTATDSANFYYKFLVRGPRFFNLVTGGLTDWWSKANVKLELFDTNKADFLRTGEQVQIVAINRPTGYVGSVTAPLKLNRENDRTTIDVPIDQLKLGPPNLKVRAERQTQTQLDLTKKEGDKYLIGSEGAGLKSDIYIKLTTEWFDEEGGPLPSDLPGYSALLANITGPNQLGSDSACGSKLNEIEIQPGVNPQLLKLKDGCDLQNQHYYLYVCGHNRDSSGRDQCFNFKGKGRPTNYVPIKVPLLDEIASRQQENIYRYAKQDGLLTAEQLKPENKPKPIYNWAYRPEMQFSVYELGTKSLKLSYKDEDEQVQEIDLEKIDQNKFNDILNNSSYFDLLFDLDGNPNDPLTPFGSSKELDFVFGENEKKATIGGSNSFVRFENLDHIVHLAPEDFFTIRLIQNNDTENVLWEWAFYSLLATVDNNRDGDIVTSSPENTIDDSTSEDRPYMFWVNNDYDVVSDKGSVKLDLTRCPTEAKPSEQKCEQWDEPASVISSNISSNNLSKIESERDLEDFAPLLVRLALEKSDDGKVKLPEGMTFSMKANNININLYRGAWEKGTDYLTDADVMENQVKPNIDVDGKEEPAYLFKLEHSDQEKFFSQEEIVSIFGTGNQAKLIFEGYKPSPATCQNQPGECYLELLLKRGNELVTSTKVFMQLYDVKNYYDHYSVGDGQAQNGPTLLATATNLHDSVSELYQKYNINIGLDEEFENEYIMFVHGWRMKYKERVSFGETAFKRLYWSGYKGEFGLFSWPTGWFDLPAYLYGPAQLPYVTGNFQNYGDSEALARQIGPKLTNLLVGLKEEKNVHIFAHSMGNVVVSEALRFSGGTSLVAHYVASQAAEVAGAYKPLQSLMKHRAPVANITFSSPEDAWRFYNLDNHLLDVEYEMPPNHYSYTIPALHGATSPDFEHQEATQEGWGAGYYAGIKQSAGRIVNFFNKKDAALLSWELNQLTKPDFLDGPTWEYDYSWDCLRGVACLVDPYPDTEKDDKVTDVYKKATNEILWNLQPALDANSADILGHIVPARTNALGQVSVSGAASEVAFNISLNKTSSAFNDANQGHSAQFYGNYILRKNYWKSLLSEFGFILDGNID